MNLLLVENREAIGKLIVSAEDLANEATGMMRDVRKGIGDPRIIGKTVRDADGLLVSARKSIDGLTPKAASLMDDATRLTSLITEERIERTLKVADNAVALTGKANKLVDNVNGMVKDLRKGKGSVGAFLVREEIYADVREMIRDLKRNPWKFFWKE